MNKHITVTKAVIALTALFILTGGAVCLVRNVNDSPPAFSTESDTLDREPSEFASYSYISPGARETAHASVTEPDVSKEEPSFAEVDISDPDLLMSLTATLVFGDRDWITGLDACREVGLGTKTYDIDMNGMEGKEVYVYFIGVASVPGPSEASDAKAEMEVLIGDVKLIFPLNGEQSRRLVQLPTRGAGKTTMRLTCGEDMTANVLMAIGKK